MTWTERQKGHEWRRHDGAAVCNTHRGEQPWVAYGPMGLSPMGRLTGERERHWKTAAAAMAAVDKDYPPAKAPARLKDVALVYASGAYARELTGRMDQRQGLKLEVFAPSGKRFPDGAHSMLAYGPADAYAYACDAFEGCPADCTCKEDSP